MNMKERLVTLLMSASGMLGLGSANAQGDNAPTKTDSTELLPWIMSVNRKNSTRISINF